MYLCLTGYRILVFVTVLTFWVNSGWAVADVSVSEGNKDQMQTAMIDKDRLYQNVMTLQETGNRSLWQKQWMTAKWIKDRVQQDGLQCRIDRYEWKGKEWPNIIATKPGGLYPDRIVVAMAHLDSYADNHQDAAPGADDNGSGVAVLMELSRILATRPNEKTIILAFFSNEENSSQGSKAFVRQAVDYELKIEAAINIDVLGYNNSKAFSLAEAVGAHSTFKHKLKACYRIFANRVNSALKGNNLIKVAGQKTNAGLVEKVAQNLETIDGLKVVRIKHNDCG